MSMGAPANTGADADHEREGGGGAERVGGERVELSLEGVSDAEAGRDQLLVDPRDEGLLRFGWERSDARAEEEGEVLGRGVGFGEDLGVPVVDGEFVGCFCLGVNIFLKPWV